MIPCIIIVKNWNKDQPVKKDAFDVGPFSSDHIYLDKFDFDIVISCYFWRNLLQRYVLVYLRQLFKNLKLLMKKIGLAQTLTARTLRFLLCY